MTARVSFTSRNGSPVDAALATPTAAKAPAVVVIQEWWGLNPQIEKTCERFASEGFLALAPDLYHGKLTAKADEAQHLMQSLDWGRALEDLAGAVAYLREHERSTGKVSVMGFCMGGALSFAVACNVRGLSAVAPFYGVPGDQDWSKVEAPIQAHFAKNDDWATPEKGAAIQAAVQKAGGSMELFVYDAAHAFFNETRPEVYSKDDAELAWKRTVEFLRAHTS